MYVDIHVKSYLQMLGIMHLCFPCMMQTGIIWDKVCTYKFFTGVSTLTIHPIIRKLILITTSCNRLACTQVGSQLVQADMARR